MRRNPAEHNCHQGHRASIRQRFLTGGLDVFAPHEVLEFLLFYTIPQKDTNPLAHQLIEKYGSLYKVLSMPVEELKVQPGVGERTALFLSLVFQLGRWIRLEQMRSEGAKFTSTKTIASYFQEVFFGQTTEAVYELCIDQKGDPIVCHRMSEGNIVSVSFNVRALVSNALLSGSEHIVIAHNHPNGTPKASNEDYIATRRIQEALQSVGIVLQDHIIVSGAEYTSMKDDGFIN